VDELLPEYEQLLARIAATRAKLKAELYQALMATRGAGE
jgi:type I restriction enzyme M protein